MFKIKLSIAVIAVIVAYASLTNAKVIDNSAPSTGMGTGRRLQSGGGNLNVSLDWVWLGAVNAPGNQAAQWGSVMCHADALFAVTTATESKRRINLNMLDNFSEQYAVDCMGVADICENGVGMETALNWASSHSFPSETDIPWTGTKGQSCNPDGKPTLSGSKVGSWEKLENLSDAQLRSELNNGPVIVKLKGDANRISNYQSGNVVSTCGDSNPNNDTEYWGTLVGFHNKNWIDESNGHVVGKRTWRVKMANGTSWGDGGYIWIDVNGGICGINNEVYVVNHTV